ncbi:MAG: sensor histidine kinase [Lachnospiraceae bacterium]|nr:sensor histidine kinase [Lachnospiraceae bacterium]
MKRKWGGLLAGVLLFCAVLAGNGTAWMVREEAYEEIEFSETKHVKKLVKQTRNEVYNLLYNLFWDNVSAEDIASDSTRLDAVKQLLGDCLQKYTDGNLRLKIYNSEGEALFDSVSREMDEVSSDRWKMVTNQRDEQNNLVFATVHLKVFLSEHPERGDEVFERYEYYRLFRGLRWLFPAAGAVLLAAVFALILLQKRNYRGSFPGDAALLLGAAASVPVIFAVVRVDWKGQSWGLSLLWSEALCLTVLFVVWRLFPLVASQIGTGVFRQNLASAHLRGQTRYALLLTAFALAQGGVLVVLFCGNSVDRALAFVQLFLLLLLLALLLLWNRKTGQRLQEAVEERMKGERLKTELITNVSHDVKTPVTSILNYVDLLKREVGAEEKLAPYIEVLERQSHRLRKLVTEIVEASKAATGNIEMDIRELDLLELLRQTFGEYEERLAQAGLTLVAAPEFDGETVLVYADGDYLWRIFDNLLSNICKYAKSGTRVYAEMKTDGEMCYVTLKNISEAPLNISEEELFERFVRGDSARSTEGSGLGLTIAKSFAELMNGTLRIVIDGDMFKAEVGLRTEREKTGIKPSGRGMLK